jgi:hypothetical protein
VLESLFKPSLAALFQQTRTGVVVEMMRCIGEARENARSIRGRGERERERRPQQSDEREDLLILRSESVGI